MLKACILFWSATILGTFSATAAFANIVGEESRVILTDGYREMGLSALDVLRIRQATGFVYCPGTVHGNGATTSGALINYKGHQLLVSNSHTFVDKQGRRREPLSECTFKTQGQIPEERRLDFSPGAFEFIENWPVNNALNDYSVVRLVAPMVNTTGLPLADESQLLVGRPFILVSAQPVREKDPFPVDIPVAQVCQIQVIYQPDPVVYQLNTVFHGDCDISPGASGSVGIFMIDGQPHAFSVASGGGKAVVDGFAYSEQYKSFSFHTALQGNVMNAIRRIAR